jgi:hypothetical protein
MSGSNQGVRDLVQKGAANSLQAISFNEVKGELNGFRVEAAKPHLSLAAIKEEGPVVEVEAREQFVRELPGFHYMGGEGHRWPPHDVRVNPSGPILGYSPGKIKQGLDT